MMPQLASATVRPAEPRRDQPFRGTSRAVAVAVGGTADQGTAVGGTSVARASIAGTSRNSGGGGAASALTRSGGSGAVAGCRR